MAAPEGSRVRKALFLVLFMGLLLLVARLFYPFLSVLLWSAVIYAFLEPLHRRAATRRGGQARGGFARTLLAGLFAVLGMLAVVTPAVLLGTALVRQASELLASVLAAINKHPEWLDLGPEGVLGGLVARLSSGRVDLSALDLAGEITGFLSSRVGSIIGFSGAVVKDAVGVIVTLAFMLFTLYFYFADGRHLVEILTRALPIERSYTTRFLGTLREAGRQLVLGYFLMALFQSAMFFGLCLAFQVKGALVLAALAIVASFVPMVGTSLVWLPVAATMALSGNMARGLLFAGLAAIFVSTLDNFIRPLVLRDRLKIHPLLIFFSILGGLSLLGFDGLLLGPLILMLFFAATELFDAAYARNAPEDQSSPSSER